MKYYIILLISLVVYGKRAAAHPAIAESLARLLLLQQGASPNEASQFAIEDTEGAGSEEALGYYRNYPFEETPIFNTTSGLIKGAKFNESYAFYSIPFADPPERFKAPVPLSAPLPLINATEADVLVCEQLQRNCSNGICTQNTNEDCLVLNVHAPLGVNITANGATTSIRPVLVWFFGGAFFMGGGTIPQFEARYFAEKTDAVIVTVNYRLGAYGFLVYGNGTNAIKGNFGFKDQQLALEWVHNNIKMFGGNPDMVTIFGESAGAQSVMFHLVSSISKPYFNRAIMESNPAVFPYQTLDQAKIVSAHLVEALHCEGISDEKTQECLKNKNSSEINQALPKVMVRSLVKDQDLYNTIEPFRPVLDGEEFTKQPFEMFADGTWNIEKDVLMGTNANELEILQFFIPTQGPNGTEIQFGKRAYEELNRFIFGNTTGNLVSERYESDYNGSDYKVIVGIEATHMFFQCPSRLLARFATATSKSGQVYLYNNAQPMNGTNCQDVVKPPEMCGYAYHASDPPLVFGSGPFYGYEFQESDTVASNQFAGYWTNFAITGHPSDKGAIDGVSNSLGPFQIWPVYNGTLDNPTSWENVIIDGDSDPGNTVDEAYLDDICDFWDSLNYYYDLSTLDVSITATTPRNDNTTTVRPNDVTTTIEATTSGSRSSKQFFFATYLLMSLSLLTALYT